MFDWGISEEKVERWQAEKNVKKLGKAAHANEEAIRKKAAAALLSLAMPEALQCAESLLEDPSEEIQVTVAQGFRDLHHLPASDQGRAALALALRDREALLALGDKVQPYLVHTLEHPEQARAGFAAEVLKQEHWSPTGDIDQTRFLLAQQDFSHLTELGARALPVIDKYCAVQQDQQLRRRAATALMEISSPATMPYLEKFARDKDEEISSLAKSRREEFQRKAFVASLSSKWKGFFAAPERNATEATATAFIQLAMRYLEHSLYYEAYCMLALADYIYEKLTGGYVIKEGLRMSDLHTQREREIKVYGDFKLEGVLELIAEKIRGKKQAGTLATLLLGAQKEDSFSTESLKLRQLVAGTQVHDAELLEATVKFLNAHDNDSRRAWRAILHLPDKRLVLSLIDAFRYNEFVFEPLQALVYLDEEAVPELLNALAKEDHKFRCNAAFGLGLIGQENTREALQQALQKETVPAAKVALHFALARMEVQNGHVEALFQAVAQSNVELARHAARCIRHLKKGLAAARLRPHFDHKDDVVRIHMIGAVSNAEPPVPEEVVHALVRRLLVEKDNEVLQRLESVLSEMKDNPALVQQLLARLPEAPATAKERIVSILGNLGAKESIEVLLGMWSSANTSMKRNLIWTFGQLGAMPSLKFITQTLRTNEELRRVAAFALVMLSSVDRDTVAKELRQIANTEAYMALALLSEEDAVRSLRGGLSSYNDVQTIFANLDAAAVVHHRELAKPLFNLLEYSNENYAPTDRYVRHGAIQALVKTLLAE